MAEFTLVAETGRSAGSRNSRRLRREGKIPGILYGHGTDPVALAIDGRELRHALSTEAGTNALLNLQVNGGSQLAMARMLQRDPVRNTVIHVDFQIVSRDEVVQADVSIHLHGEAIKVKHGDGVVEQQLFHLTVSSTPARIPTEIQVDISELAIGEAIRVGDIKLPDGVTTDADPDESIVVGQASQVSELDLVPEADLEKLEELAEAQAEAEAAEAAEGGDAAPSAPAEGESGGGEAQG